MALRQAVKLGREKRRCRLRTGPSIAMIQTEKWRNALHFGGSAMDGGSPDHADESSITDCAWLYWLTTGAEWGLVNLWTETNA